MTRLRVYAEEVVRVVYRGIDATNLVRVGLRMSLIEGSLRQAVWVMVRVTVGQG